MDTYNVRIFNPETMMIDSTCLEVVDFSVRGVFDALEAQKWTYQPGTYVAFRVTEPNGYQLPRWGYGDVLTFRIDEEVRTTVELVATPV